jgi:methyl-accepting chemotaxis protein
MADGDLTSRMEGDYRGDFDILKTAMNETLESVGDTMSQINVAVEQVAEGSVQVSQASQALSQGATEQAASLEEITSSTTEISSQTRQNTENAVKMNSLAKEAQGNAVKGNQQMKDLVSAMTDINASAEEIRKIVKAIDDISFQINLLALNANVEAARAGKYGKGFAVVAEEVRNLAVRSANSVKETTRMVDEAISNIQRGNVLVDGTAKQLNEIVTGAEEVSVIAEEVSVAGREQTQGLDQIAQGLNQIDQVTQNNTASAEESASASEELSSQAQQVKSMLSRFKLNTGTAIRAQNNPREADARQPRKPIPVTSANRAQPVAARRKMPVRPSDIISLDDDNFGKF